MSSRLSQLSDESQSLVDLIGYNSTRALCEGWGGGEVYIPMWLPRLHPLALRIGHRAALLLSQEYGGKRIHVPHEPRAMRDIIIQMIIDDSAAGATPRDLSQKYGFTVRAIRGYIERGRKDERD